MNWRIVIGQKESSKVVELAQHSADIVRANRDGVNIKIRTKTGLIGGTLKNDKNQGKKVA